MARTDRPLTAGDFHDLIETTYDQLHIGNEENLAIQSAGIGAQRLRSTVAAEGRAATVKMVVKSGVSKSLANAIVDEATKEGLVLPLGLLSVLSVESQQERIRLVPLAMTSNETARWVDDVDNVDDDEPASFRSTAELMELARDAGDHDSTFHLVMMVARRVLRSDRALRAALYLVSNDLERDRRAYAAGEASPNVKRMFDLVGMVLDGAATDKKLAKFSEALLARVEEVNGTEPGAVRDALRERARKQSVGQGGAVRYSYRGPDAMVWSTTPDGRPHLIVGYASPLSLVTEVEEIASALNDRWRDLPMTDDADLLVVIAGASPVMEIKRMGGEDGVRVAAWADDVAMVRTADTMFAMTDPTVVPAMTRGQAAFAGWFQSARPALIDAAFAAVVQGSLDRLVAAGYPDSNQRGHDIMNHSFLALSAWVAVHPESFPYFGNRDLVAWVNNCPMFLNGVGKARSGLRALLDYSRDRAIEHAEGSRSLIEQGIQRHRARAAQAQS
ncbi:hypothetical protein KDX23_07535 [Burkholderia vietnamiensis]|uniref:hypothetical protein n=1 Tax=Burkholderia vietnamiensis TaxID=60552 RepID=UPI001BA36A80|nr:hypothetical protein [Burkholderia vietnamiensis]MBR8082596.1 hypothetical protein [Burkholderia vietnamiensis]